MPFPRPTGVLLLAVLAAAPAPAEDAPGLRAFLAVRGGDVLASENAELPVTPGSVLKLVVTAAAVHQLGLDYRVETLVRGPAPSEGTLDGDLVVVAAGDPTWNERFFEADPRAPLLGIARELRGRGLRRVTGDLVVDRSRFPGRGAAVSRPASELAYAYGVPASALSVDENTVRVEIAPGEKVGDPARLRPLPGAERFDWKNRMRTVGCDRHEHGTVDIQPVWETAEIVVRGEYPVSEPSYRIAVAVPDPDRHAGLALREALAAEGISVAGEVRVVDQGVSAGEVLARFRSPPLGEILTPILTDSQNFYAEMLLRLLAAKALGTGRDDEALKLVSDFLTEEVGVRPGSFSLDDGSGLSPYNLLSPAAVVTLLRWIGRQSWRDAYFAALARPGVGTLVGAWGNLPAGLRAKTGSIRGSVGIAGFFKEDDRPLGGSEGGHDQMVYFAAFVGHRREEAPILRGELAAWVRSLPRLSAGAASRSQVRPPPPR